MTGPQRRTNLKKDNRDDGPPVDVSVVIDEHAVTAPSGQSLAAVLHSMGYSWWHRNPVTQQPRGPFCGMGVCFECELLINGRPHRACLTEPTDGMVITTERERHDS